MSFRLSSEINPQRTFLLKRSELEGRFDPFCYIPELIALDKLVKSKTSYTLNDFTIFKASGATPSKNNDELYSDNVNGIPFVRVQNLSSTGELDLSDIIYIAKNTHENFLKRSQVKEYDLLVKITGVGRMAVASVAPKGFVGNINQHIVVIRTESKEISENIATFLNLDSIERLASKRSTGGTRPALDYSALLSIPVMNNADITNFISKAVETKKQKEAEAQHLLDGIDEYLLKELGVELPDQRNNSIKSRVFTRKLSQIDGGRFDPNYFQKYYQSLTLSLRNGRYTCKEIKDFTILVLSGSTPSSGDYSEISTDSPIIKVASYEGAFISLDKVAYSKKVNSKTVKKNDIFILSAAHQPSYVGRFIKFLDTEPTPNTSYVGELICIRTDELSCNPMYLFSLLNIEVYKVLLNVEKRGQTSHIYPKDIKHINVPLPPLKIQNKMAATIIEIRNQAKQLQQEAKDELDQAKKKVEAMILGEV